MPDDLKHTGGLRVSRRRNEGSLSVFFWSISGVILASCGGGGGSPEVNYQELPAYGASSGGVRGVDVYADIHGDGTLDNAAFIGTTDSSGVIEVPGRYQGMRLLAVFEGAVEEHTGDGETPTVLTGAGVYRSLSGYTGQDGRVLISPLTELLADAETTQAQQAILDGIFGSGRVSVEDILDASNYFQGIDAEGEEILGGVSGAEALSVQQLVSRAAVAYNLLRVDSALSTDGIGGATDASDSIADKLANLFADIRADSSIGGTDIGANIAEGSLQRELDFLVTGNELVGDSRGVVIEDGASDGIPETQETTNGTLDLAGAFEGVTDLSTITARVNSLTIDEAGRMITGTHGSFMVSRSAESVIIWTYTLNNAATNVQALDGVSSVEDQIRLDVTEGASNDLDQYITVTVRGTNDDPIIATNTGLTLDEGATVAITSTLLSATDVDDVDNALTYTITGGLEYGSLMLGDDVVTSFTQADLATLMYVHDGSHVASDSFAFTVSDDEGGTASGTFAITVTLSNDSPELAPEDTDAIILDKSRASSISGRLIFSDEETALADLTLERVTGPSLYAALGETYTSADMYGTFTFTVNTEEGFIDWVYTLNLANPTVDALARGALMDSVTISLSDADGARDNHEIEVSIVADSHAPSLRDPGSIEIEHDTGLPAESTADGMFITDRARQVELEYSVQTSGETPVMAVQSARAGFTHSVAGAYGSLFYHEATGAYEYIANIMTLDDYTGTEPTLMDSFAVTVSDGFNTDSGSLAVSITGLESDYDQVYVTASGSNRYSGYRSNDGDGLLAEEEDGSTTAIDLGALGGGVGANDKSYAVLSGEMATDEIFTGLGITSAEQIAKIRADSASFSVTAGNLVFTGAASGDFDLSEALFYDILVGVTDLGADGVVGGDDDTTTHEIYRVYLSDKNEVPIFDNQPLGTYSRNSVDFAVNASVEHLRYRVINHDATEDEGIEFDSATGRLTLTLRYKDDANTMLPTIQEVLDLVDPRSGDFGNLALISAAFDADNMAGDMLTTAYDNDWSGSGFDADGFAPIVDGVYDLGSILSSEVYILRESIFGVSDADIGDQDDEGRADGSIIMYRLDTAPSVGNIQVFNGTNWVNLAELGEFSLEQLRDGHVRYEYSGNAGTDADVRFSLSAADDALVDADGRSAEVDYSLAIEFEPTLRAETVVVFGLEFTRPNHSPITHMEVFSSTGSTYGEALGGLGELFITNRASQEMSAIVQSWRDLSRNYDEASNFQGIDIREDFFDFKIADGFMGSDLLYSFVSINNPNPLYIEGVDLPKSSDDVFVYFGTGMVYERGDMDVRVHADGTTTAIAATTTSTYGDIAYRDVGNVATGLTLRVALTEEGLGDSSTYVVINGTDDEITGAFGTFTFTRNDAAGRLYRENPIDGTNELTNFFARTTDTSTGLLRWDYALDSEAASALTGENTERDSIWIEVTDSDGHTARQEITAIVKGQDLSPIIAPEPNPLVIANEGMIALDEVIIPVSDLDTPIEDGVFTIESLGADVVIRLTNADGTTDLEATETFTYASLVADEISLHHITSGGTDLGFRLSFSNGEGTSDTSVTRAYAVALEGYAHAAELEAAATPPIVTDGMSHRLDAAFFGLSDDDHAALADFPDEYTFTASSVVHGMLLRGTTPITANADGTFTFTLGEVRSTNAAEQIFFRHESGQSDASFALTVADELGIDTSASETYNFNVPERPVLGASTLPRVDNAGAVGLSPTNVPASDPDVTMIPNGYTYTVSAQTGGAIVVRRDVGGTPMDVTLTDGMTFTHEELNSEFDDSGVMTRTVRFVDDAAADMKTISFTLILTDDTPGTALMSDSHTYQITTDNNPPVLATQTSTGLTVALGGTYDITTDNFEVYDVDPAPFNTLETSVPGGFIFTVSNPAGGEIRLNDTMSNTFTMDDVRNDRVDFVHDNRTASGIQFSLRIRDLVNNDSVDTITITFANVTVPDRAPVLTATAGSTGNTFTGGSGGRYTLLTTDFELTDADLETIPRDFTLIASGLVGVTLELDGLIQSSTSIEFNMGNVIDGDVVFIHDNMTDSDIHFELQARDGTSPTPLPSASIEIRFNNVDVPDDPVLTTTAGSTGNTFTNDEYTLLTTDFMLTDADHATIPRDFTFTASNLVGVTFVVANTPQVGTTVGFTMGNIIDGNVVVMHDGRTGTGIGFDLTATDATLRSSSAIAIAFDDVEVGTPPLLRADTVTIAGLRFTLLDETLPFGGFNVMETTTSSFISTDGGITTFAIGARSNTIIQDVIDALNSVDYENRIHAELVSGSASDSFESSIVLEANRLADFDAIDEIVVTAIADAARTTITESFLRIIDPDATLPFAGDDYTFRLVAQSGGQLAEVGGSYLVANDQSLNRDEFTLTDVRGDNIRFDHTTGAGDSSFTLEVTDGDGNTSTQVTYHFPIADAANLNAPVLAAASSRSATVEVTVGSVVHGIRFDITDATLGSTATQFILQQAATASHTRPEIFDRNGGVEIIVPRRTPESQPTSTYTIQQVLDVLNVRDMTSSSHNILGRFTITYEGTATETERESIDFTPGIPLSPARAPVPITDSNTETATAGQPFVLDHETIQVSDADITGDIPADYRFEVQAITNGRLTVAGRDGNLGEGDFFTLGQLRADQVTFTNAYGTTDGTLTLTVSDGRLHTIDSQEVPSAPLTYTFDVPDTLPNAAAPVLDMERTATFYHTDNIHGIKFTWLPGAAGRPTEALVIQETSSGTFLANDLGNPPHIKVYMGTGLVAPYLSLERIIQIVNTPEGTIPANHLHAEYVGPPGGEDTILGHYYNNSSFYIRAPISPSETSNTIDIADGGSLILDENFIRVSDADIANPIDIPDSYTFTIVSVTNGSVIQGITTLNPTNTFTMEDLRSDVASEQITFQHMSGMTDGTLELTVFDGTNISTALTYTFDVPQVSVLTALADTPDLNPEFSDTVESYSFSALPFTLEDPDDVVIPENFTFTASNPRGGNVYRNGDLTQAISTFTYHEVRRGQIDFYHDGSTTTQQGISVDITVTDPDDGLTSDPLNVVFEL